MGRDSDTENQIYFFDFTLPQDGNSRDTIIKILNEWAKNWVFQLEKAPSTGYMHWQGRLSLHKKMFKRQAISTLTEAGIIFGDLSATQSTTSGAKKAFQYVMKADTREDGPWKDSDPPPPPLTKQIEKIVELYPWQKTVVRMLENWDDRCIHCVIEKHGNNGKSGFVEWLEYHNKAFEIPSMRLMEDIMQCVMSYEPQTAYIIDMPRALGGKMGDFYSGIECLKNGLCYDKRYKFKKRRMNRPQIFIFTNNVPDLKFLSQDRWKFWQISLDKKLHSYTINTNDIQ